MISGGRDDSATILFLGSERLGRGRKSRMLSSSASLNLAGLILLRLAFGKVMPASIASCNISSLSLANRVTRAGASTRVSLFLFFAFPPPFSLSFFLAFSRIRFFFCARATFSSSRARLFSSFSLFFSSSLFFLSFAMTSFSASDFCLLAVCFVLAIVTNAPTTSCTS